MPVRRIAEVNGARPGGSSPGAGFAALCARPRLAAVRPGVLGEGDRLSTAAASLPHPPQVEGPIPVAASTAVRAVLEGPPRCGHVLAAFPSAVYVDMGPEAEPRVLAVVSPDAVRLPVAVVLPPSSSAPLTTLRAGAPTRVGEGELRAGPVHVRVARWWSPVPAIGAVTAATLRQRTAELRGVLDGAQSRGGLAGHPAPHALASACAAGDRSGAAGAAGRLVGLGPGLTPSGDDILAGLLLSLRLLGGALPGDGAGRRDGPLAMADAVAGATTADLSARTTAVAATLLRCAARGEAATEVSTALSALAGRTGTEPAMHRLLDVGHTSGADLGRGLLAGCVAGLRLAG